MRRLIGKLKTTRRIADFLVYANFVAKNFADSAYFTTPPAALASLVAHTEAAEAAELATKRLQRVTKARDAALALVKNDLSTLLSVAQRLAEADPENATIILASLGFELKKTLGPRRALFKIKQGRVSGSVDLSAKAVARKATYYWQYSVDGKKWILAKATMVSKATLTRLTPGVRYSFRFRARTPAGLGNFSQVLVFTVS